MQKRLRARAAAALVAAGLALLAVAHDPTLRAATPTGGTLAPTWNTELNDHDVYVHQGSNAGPEEVGRSGDSAPQVVEENTVDVNAIVVAGVNDTAP